MKRSTHHPSHLSVSPLDKGCPPFLCSESRFPSSSHISSTTTRSNANTPPEQWGLTVNQLNDFVRWCKSHPRWDWIKSQHEDRSVSLYEVDSFFVRPWTEGRGAGVALCMNSDYPKQANLYLCHSWAEDLEELVQSANRHCQAHHLDRNETVVWCCIFALYQNDDDARGITIKKQVQMSPPPFEAGVSSASKQHGVLLCHTQHGDVCSRLWCIFEIFKATSVLSSPLHIGCSDAFSYRLISMWRLGHHHLCLPRSRDAKCTMDEDRHYIISQLKQVNNCWTKVDSAVYLARRNLAKHLGEQALTHELNLIKSEEMLRERHLRTMKSTSLWIKLKLAVMRNRPSVLPMSCTMKSEEGHAFPALGIMHEIFKGRPSRVQWFQKLRKRSSVLPMSCTMKSEGGCVFPALGLVHEIFK